MTWSSLSKFVRALLPIYRNLPVWGTNDPVMNAAETATEWPGEVGSFHLVHWIAVATFATQRGLLPDSPPGPRKVVTR
jgi:hypothetical protein